MRNRRTGARHASAVRRRRRIAAHKLQQAERLEERKLLAVTPFEALARAGLGGADAFAGRALAVRWS